ncbi:Phage integrase [gamma proteobacterium IMCC2047]|nr:Phage integrase [gamma proteobacterium IMCC2047]
MEAAPLQDQAIFHGTTDYRAEGSPYSDFMEHLAFKHDIGGRYSDAEPHEQRAIDILHGQEKVTLLDVKALAEKQAQNHKKKVENERFFNYFLDNIPSKTLQLGAIRRKHIQDAVDKLLAEGKKTGTVKKPLDYVRKHVRETIHLYELNITNPFDGVKVKGHGTDVEKRKPFTLDQLNKVKQAIINKKDLPTSQIAGLLADTGCRNGEIGGIRLDHIILDHDIPHLKIAEQVNRRLKNKNSERVVPLVGLSLVIAKHIVSKAKDDQVYAFETYNQNNSYNNDNCSAATNKLIKGICPNHTSHSFRHTLRDRLYDASVPAHEVNNLAGWAAEKMVDHYGLSKGLERLYSALQTMLKHENNKN